ncbi:CAP domain-containing protein [Candidatus Saccharibacteria bacterium]|nr:CAP domain-containing protein [Candidatus Saccharibacteria bacterium]
MNTIQQSLAWEKPHTASSKSLKVIRSAFYMTIWLLSLVLSIQFGLSIQKSTSISASSKSSSTDNVRRPQVLASFDSVNNTDSSLPSADEIFNKVNSVREQNGLQPLVKDSVLANLAQQRASDMVTRNYYAHEDPDGKLFYNHLEQIGYSTGFACENLDLSFINSANQYISDWFNSTHGHKECMLDTRLTSAGYAVSSFDTGNGTKEYLIVAIHAEIR